MDVGEGHAGVVIDGHEDEVPAGPLNGIASVARDPVARALDTSQLLDVDVQQIAGGLMLVAHHRLGRLQVGQVRQTGAGQDAADVLADTPSAWAMRLGSAACGAAPR
ncbi:hypothetical protein L502_2525 [Bordetella holmesii CDC-H785-BH]|nr:hypothetical protein L502_2525 [Bordetella holmesii CDC-H785-BH]